ncbi:hypothetical protein ASPCAL10068 [Aspergillus calidoustus]|uniref:Uncharacterized protein n=1 Tax=Aspergillus calidoustus TaxID=454130 RepID=A0A0U5G5H8_ASPCI|nr:hypothetical protein ASPCAL10068 [Aspergillus calidoustus]
MVELLCQAKVTPKIRTPWTWKAQPWEYRLPILRTLLAYGADPDSFVTEEEPGFPLINAAKDGCLDAVQLLLSNGATLDLSIPSHNGTALQAAVFEGHVDVAKYLITCGADTDVPYISTSTELPYRFSLNQGRIYLQTPVQIAAERDNTPLLQILLDYGACVWAYPIAVHPAVKRVASNTSSHELFGEVDLGPWYKRGSQIYTALQYAAINQNLDMARLLLSRGIDPDSRIAPDIGDTPLQISARLGNITMSHLFLNSGADINATPDACKGRTALQGAAESGNLELLLLLQKHGAWIGAPAAKEFGLTALQAACYNGHSVIVGSLLAHGADANEPPASLGGLTSLQGAVSHGDMRLIRDLINLGAEADSPATYMGKTALLASVKHRSLPIVELLIQHGANVNQPRDCRYITLLDPTVTPLQEAAREDWLQGVELLLKHGANANYLAPPGEYEDVIADLLSPLGWAISNGSEAMVELLLDHGASVRTVASWIGVENMGALVSALRYEPDPGIIQLLLAKAPHLEKHYGWEATLEALLYGGNEMPVVVREMVVEKVLSMPPSLYQTVVRKGWNALPDSDWMEDEDCLCFVELFTKIGAPLDECDENETTLLQRITACGYSQCCRFLIKHGAAVNTHAAKWHGTPLQQALKNGYTEAANALLDHGADVNALPATYHGVTALQAASIDGLPDMVVRLLELGADVDAPAAPIEGRTAINGAAERGYWDIVQILLNAYQAQEADLMPVCVEAAEYAEREGHINLAEWLRGYSPA